MIKKIKPYLWFFKGDFARLWLGLLASNLATWLLHFSLIWWSIDVFGASLQGGILMAMGVGITVLLSPWSGWSADRFHRGHLMAFSDMLFAGCFVLLAFLAYFNLLELWHLYIIQATISLVKAPIRPAFQSLLPDVVSHDRLEKGNALQSTVLELNQAAGPILAASIIAFSSYEFVWGLCAILVGVSAFFEWRIYDPRGAQPNVAPSRKRLSSGFSALFQNKPLRLLAVSTALTQLFFSGFPLYLAVLAASVLDGGALTAGTLQTFWAIGIVTSSFILSFVAKQKHTKLLVPVSNCILGLFVLLLGWVHQWPYTYIFLLLAGSFSGIVNVYLTGFLQRASEGENRARILSAFIAVNTSLIPVGYLLAGILSENLPAGWLFVIVASPSPFIAWFIWRAVSVWETQNHHRLDVS